jgi:hypothetical protein
MSSHLMMLLVQGGGGGGIFVGGDAGLEWTERTRSAVLLAVAYGDGLWVIGGLSGSEAYVATSPDGITWTTRTSVSSNAAWTHAAYGNGLFVVLTANVDATNKCMTSPDGITWTARSIPAAYFASVYANDTWVAVRGEASNQVATSPDGITWTARTAPDSIFRSVAHGNGTFVAVGDGSLGNSGVYAMTSPDGITWTSRTVPTATQWNGVTFANGRFVAVGGLQNQGGYTMHSFDGVTWTAGDTTANALSSVAYGDGVFVATSWDTLEPTNLMYRSTDGIVWASVTAPVGDTRLAVAHGDGRFVAVGFETLITSDTTGDGGGNGNGGGGGGGDPPPELTGFAVSGDAGDYADVLGTYCPDGTHNGKNRYKNDENNTTYYLAYADGKWLITWLREPADEEDFFNHLWAAATESDTPPATFFGNAFLNAAAENLTVSAASCP